MKILIAGGAGYIGSVCTELLLRHGLSVAVVDNLSRGHRQAVPHEAEFYCGDIGDAVFLDSVFRAVKPAAVMHFCALSLVGESIENPLAYYQNNVAAGLILLRTMLAHGVTKLIFSSTAAIFGEPQLIPIPEDAPPSPVNPYGASKWMFEQILRDLAKSVGFRSVSLRYFNAAGATDIHGEDHRPESHLIPLLLDVALGKRDKITVFGNDYPTHDGSCIRDYIHVADLAQAHLLALEYLDCVKGAEVFNLGNGHGFSVFEIIAATQTVTARRIPVEIGPRRPGDPAVLVASSEKIRRVLGWNPRYPDIHEIIQSAWRWKREHPHGYAD
ncbi:MAG: UDP-glucose 4-epimerase GalE [Candidatus Sumerlaeaceae bacterium]